MNLATAFRDRRVVVMAALGFASGVGCSFVYQVEPLWRELSVGVSFGVVVAVYLFHLGLAGPFRALALAVLTVLSWWAAERAAIEIFGRLSDGGDFLSWQGLVTGVVAGIVGAALLVLSIAVLFPFFRRPRLCLATILVGGASGALLVAIDLVDSGLVLFPLWQAAFAFCFALGFPEIGAVEDDSP